MCVWVCGSWALGFGVDCILYYCTCSLVQYCTVAPLCSVRQIQLQPGPGDQLVPSYMRSETVLATVQYCTVHTVAEGNRSRSTNEQASRRLGAKNGTRISVADSSIYSCGMRRQQRPPLPLLEVPVRVGVLVDRRDHNGDAAQPGFPHRQSEDQAQAKGNPAPQRLVNQRSLSRARMEPCRTESRGGGRKRKSKSKPNKRSVLTRRAA